MGVGGGQGDGLLDSGGAAGRHLDGGGALALDPEGMEGEVGSDGEGLGGRLEAQGHRAGSPFAPGADDGGEGVVGLAAGDLLLQDRGQQRLEHRLGAGDAQAGVVVVELADQPGGGEPLQRVARPQQLGRRLQGPPRPRPPGRDPDPVSFRRVAGRGRPLRRPGRPPPAPAPVDQVGRVARPPPQRPQGQPEIHRQARPDNGLKRKMRGGHRPDLATPSRQPRPGNRPPGTRVPAPRARTGAALWTTRGTPPPRLATLPIRGPSWSTAGRLSRGGLRDPAHGSAMAWGPGPGRGSGPGSGGSA